MISLRSQWLRSLTPLLLIGLMWASVACSSLCASRCAADAAHPAVTLEHEPDCCPLTAASATVLPERFSPAAQAAADPSASPHSWPPRAAALVCAPLAGLLASSDPPLERLRCLRI